MILLSPLFYYSIVGKNKEDKTESKPLKEPLERGHVLATDQEAECMKGL